MKWTALDISIKLFNILKESGFMELPNGPDGGIYQAQRPANSTTEDVVVNTGTLTTDTLQVGEFTVNVYSRNPNLILDGKPDNTMPNSYRLDQLTDLMKPFVQEIWGPSWNYELVNSEVKAAEANQHFVELKFEFRGIYDPDFLQITPTAQA